MSIPCRAQRLIILGLTLLAVQPLAGCSPYGFRGQAEEFSKATTELFAALDAGQQSVRADRDGLMRVQLRDGRVLPERTGACEPAFPLAQLGPCRIAARNEVGRPPRGELSADEMQRLRGIERYAQSLLALTRAADRDAMNVASARVAAAVGTMAAAAAPAAPAAMAAGPVANFGFFLVGEALDHERYLRLQTAVREAHPQLVILEPILKRYMVFLRDERIVALGAASQLLVTGIRREASGASRVARFEEAAEQVARINALQASAPAATVDAMVDAHKALRDALLDRSTQIETIAQAIQDFVSQVRTLKAALTGANRQEANP